MQRWEAGRGKRVGVRQARAAGARTLGSAARWPAGTCPAFHAGLHAPAPLPRRTAPSTPQSHLHDAAPVLVPRGRLVRRQPGLQQPGRDAHLGAPAGRAAQRRAVSRRVARPQALRLREAGQEGGVLGGAARVVGHAVGQRRQACAQRIQEALAQRPAAVGDQQLRLQAVVPWENARGEARNRGGGRCGMEAEVQPGGGAGQRAACAARRCRFSSRQPAPSATHAPPTPPTCVVREPRGHRVGHVLEVCLGPGPRHQQVGGHAPAGGGRGPAGGGILGVQAVGRRRGQGMARAQRLACHARPHSRLLEPPACSAARTPAPPQRAWRTAGPRSWAGPATRSRRTSGRCPSGALRTQGRPGGGVSGMGATRICCTPAL